MQAAGAGKTEEIQDCRPRRDFIRHIVNHVLAEVADKIPVSVFNDIRAGFSRAEDKYRFALFGGDPRRILEFLESDDWRDLVDYAKNMNVDWVLVKILEALHEAYKTECPPVAAKARELAETLKRQKEERAKQQISPDTVFRMLRLHGYKVERDEQGRIMIEGTNFTAEVEVVNGVIRYRICREGKATTVEGLEAKLKKISEIL